MQLLWAPMTGAETALDFRGWGGREESARALRRRSHGGGRELEDGLSRSQGKQSLEQGGGLTVDLST